MQHAVRTQQSQVGAESCECVYGVLGSLAPACDRSQSPLPRQQLDSQETETGSLWTSISLFP